MLLDHQVKQLFYDLIHHEAARIKMGRGEIFVRIFDDSSKMVLSTPVYSGDKFIPFNVRRCVTTHRPLEENSIPTFLKLDEQKYQVHLHYLGTVDSLNHQKFKKLLQEFHWIAEEWRDILDEHDRNDLIHVPVQ